MRPVFLVSPCGRYLSAFVGAEPQQRLCGSPSPCAHGSSSTLSLRGPVLIPSFCGAVCETPAGVGLVIGVYKGLDPGVGFEDTLCPLVIPIFLPTSKVSPRIPAANSKRIITA